MASKGPRTEVSCKRCSEKFNALDRELRRGKGLYCSSSCANSSRNDFRRNPNWKKEWYEKKRNDPFFLKQRRARHKVQNEIEQGRMKRLPCEKCGHVPSEAHHDDYDKPLEVRWLCRSHHMQHDRNKQKPIS